MAVISIGQEAPDFTLKTQDDKEWSLRAQRGKNVVLLWYPLDWSPTCEKENCQVSESKSLYGADRVVVGVSRDSVWSHRAWKAAKNLGHDLLADPTLEVTRKFGLEHPKVPFISQRATVIVDKQGKVAYVQVQEKTPEARDMHAVQAALAALPNA
ncbi:MAG: peroxiredoxin [Planctomycetes bacterium]|nr:peroxiredoxin [Planctomycetota bacterium]